MAAISRSAPARGPLVQYLLASGPAPGLVATTHADPFPLQAPDGGLFVKSLVIGSSAEPSGIVRGDLLLDVDGVSMIGQPKPLVAASAAILVSFPTKTCDPRVPADCKYLPDPKLPRAHPNARSDLLARRERCGCATLLATHS